jgi:preprotein translocase subunit SecY
VSRIFTVLRNIFTIPELRRRILFTFGLLAAFRFGSFVPLLGIDTQVLKDLMKQAQGGDAGGRLLGWLNIFSGGAITQMSILSLGIMPYISASIIFQLLVKVVPRLEAVAKEGPSGYRKIANWTRLATIPICLVQAIFMVKWLGSGDPNRMGGGLLVPDPGFFSFYLPGVLGLLAGTMMVMWLGDQITEHGIGNGASIIIMTGIVGRMPQAFIELQQMVSTTGRWDTIVIIVGLYLAVIVAIVFTTQAQRRIPVQHAKHMKGRRMYGGQKHYLPLRVNQAGVMPVIFASSIMVLPGMLFTAVRWEAGREIFSRYGFIYSTMYVALVFFFTFFWTALFFQPNEMANQLKEQGSFVPGIRPGRKTAEHLEHVMTRVTVVGATFLCMIALLPDLVAQTLNVDRIITAFLGGTGILIVVGVGLDMMQKIESYLLMRQYEGFMKKGRIRGRR